MSTWIWFDDNVLFHITPWSLASLWAFSLVHFFALPFCFMALRAQRVHRVGHLDLLLNQYHQLCHLHLVSNAMLLQLDDFTDSLEDAGFTTHPIYAYVMHSRTMMYDFIRECSRAMLAVRERIIRMLFRLHGI